MHTKTPRPGTASKGYRPDMLGDYELLAELMRDKFGSLSAARQLGGQFDDLEILVVRSIEPSAWIDAWLVEDLCQAAWGVKGQKLERVAPLHDVILADGRVGMVQDYAEGETLRTLLRAASSKRHKIAPAVVARIGLDVLAAMSSVQGLVERKPELSTLVTGGLAPDRVLVEVSGESWLFELPLSGRAAVKAVIGQDDDMLGYRSPEHYAAGGEPDIRSDLFVLGAMMWEMLAGKPLFAVIGTPGAAAKGAEAPAVQAVAKGLVPKLDGVETKLQDVVRRALDLDPARRFGSPSEMAKALGLATKPAGHAEVGKMVELLASQAMSSRKAAINRALRLSDPGGSRTYEGPASSRSPRTGATADARPQDKADARPQDKADTKPQDKADTKPQGAPARDGAPARALREGKPKGMIPERKGTLLGMPAAMITPTIVEKPDPELDDIPMDDAFAESFEEAAKQFPTPEALWEPPKGQASETNRGTARASPAPAPATPIEYGGSVPGLRGVEAPETKKESPAALARATMSRDEPKVAAAGDDDVAFSRPPGRAKMFVIGTVGAVALLGIGIAIGLAAGGRGESQEAPGQATSVTPATAPRATSAPAETASAAAPSATQTEVAAPSAAPSAPTAAESKPAETTRSEAKVSTPPQATATTRPNTTGDGQKPPTKSGKTKPASTGKGFTPSSI